MAENPMPYSVAARDYVEAGWIAPLPLPFKEKDPPPTGFTGEQAEYPSIEQIARWLGQKNGKLRGGFKGRPEQARAGNLSFLPGNIALRMPHNVIGIDVDLYDGKAGAETLAANEKKWGPLPPTWISTSRFDGSGIRYFRVPDGLQWNDVGPGVETIKWYHRYAIVMPSVHSKTGKRYIWIRPDEERVSDEFPSVDELPMLPERWVAGLSGGEAWSSSGDAGNIDYKSALAWLVANGTGELCSVMQSTFTKYERSVREAGEDGGAHDQARDGAWALLGDAKAGHTGAQEAIRQLGSVFGTAVEGRRPRWPAEWRRAVTKGVGKVREELRKLGGDGSVTETDPCDDFTGSMTVTDVDGEAVKPNKNYTFDDTGNGRRLADALQGRAVWVGGDHGYWMALNPDTLMWEKRGSAPIRKTWDEVTTQMHKDATMSSDADSAGSWAKTSRSEPRIVAAMKNAQRHVVVAPDMFDANSSVLHVANGAIELRRTVAEPYVFRAREASDYATLCSPVVFNPEAKSAIWDAFVESILPDEDDRCWVQTCTGYTIQDGNPERAWFLAIGPTSGGKGTFTGAVAAALGPYAGTYNLSLFHDKREDAPRPDILKALPQRMLYRSEVADLRALSAETIKDFTGNDPLTGRAMRSDVMVERVPAFTPWLTTNKVPDVTGADRALWRRLRCLPFLEGRTEEQEDPNLKAQLAKPKVLAAVLAWALEGWGLYLRDRLESPSANASLETAKARMAMSVAGRFVEDSCDVDPEFWVTSIDLWNQFKWWLEDNGTRAERDRANRNNFARGLTELGYVQRQRRIGERDDDLKVRGWSGLRIRGARVG